MAGAHVVGDCRYLLRQWRRAPAFTAGVLATLAAGIGANATMVATADRVALRAPAEVREPERVVRVLFRSDGEDPAQLEARSDFPSHVALGAGVPAAQAVAAHTSAEVLIEVGTLRRRMPTALVTDEYFAALGVRPAAGRLIAGTNDTPSGAGVVISHSFWRQALGGRDDVLGSIMRVDRTPMPIIGIAPAGFRGLPPETVDVWVPLALAAPSILADWRTNDGSVWLATIARLHDGATAAAFEAQASAAVRRARAARGADTAIAVVAGSLIPARAPDRPREARLALWLAVVSSLVVLIACVNVGNLLVARAMSRQREMAIRLALGSSRGRLAWLVLLEALLLSLAGGVLALVIVAIAVPSMEALLAASGTVGSPAIDPRTIATTAAACLVTAIALAIAPLYQLRHPDVARHLRDDAGMRTASPLRASLVGLQAALALLLTFGAGLFAHSAYKIASLDLGADLDRTMVVGIETEDLDLPPTGKLALLQSLTTHFAQLPQVELASYVEASPYMSGRGSAPYTAERSQQDLWEGREVAYVTAVGPGFFGTVGARSLRGRDFNDSDDARAEPVAIINRPLARHLWQDGQALGRCIFLDQRRTCTRVVGVLDGVWKFSVLRRDKMVLYVSILQQRRPVATQIFARFRGDYAAASAAVTRAAATAEPRLQVVRVQRLRDFADPEFRPFRLGLVALSLLAGAAVVIAGIGIYSVIAYAFAQRRHEIAVRLALGATGIDIAQLLARRELAWFAAGIVVAVCAAIALSDLTEPLLFQTSARDPLVLVGAIGLLLTLFFSAAATVLRHAAAVAPMSVLRVDG